MVFEEDPGDGITPSFQPPPATYMIRAILQKRFRQDKNVMLGYNIPINEKFASKLRTYFPYSKTCIHGINMMVDSPEASTYGSKKTGYDFSSYPMALVYTLDEYGILIQCRI